MKDPWFIQELSPVGEDFMMKPFFANTSLATDPNWILAWTIIDND